MTPNDLNDFIGNHVKLTVDNKDLGYDDAHDLAKHKAKELTADPMLLAWYCGKTVAAITGFDAARDNLKQIAKNLKGKCGTGGSIKDGVIIIP